MVEKDPRTKYVMPLSFNKKNVQAFIADYLAGKAEKHVKSEDEPGGCPEPRHPPSDVLAEDNSGPVKVATGRNFESLVADDKDVMIEFYAPWCGHCKVAFGCLSLLAQLLWQALAPKYEKLGKKFRKKKGVVIAKVWAAPQKPKPSTCWLAARRHSQ